MKKLLASILVLLITAMPVIAASTVSETWYTITPNTLMVNLHVVADSDGSVANHQITRTLKGLLMAVYVLPDSTTPPSDAFDIKLLSLDGLDLLGGAGVNLSDTYPRILIPTPSTSDSLKTPYPTLLSGRTFLNVTGNSDSAAVVDIQVFIKGDF